MSIAKLLKLARGATKPVFFVLLSLTFSACETTEDSSAGSSSSSAADSEAPHMDKNAARRVIEDKGYLEDGETITRSQWDGSKWIIEADIEGDTLLDSVTYTVDEAYHVTRQTHNRSR